MQGAAQGSQRASQLASSHSLHLSTPVFEQAPRQSQFGTRGGPTQQVLRDAGKLPHPASWWRTLIV